MPGTFNNIELIELYFEGKLSEIEKLAFEARMSIDPELKEEVKLYKAIVDGIKETGEDKLKKKLQSIDKELDFGRTINLLQAKKRINFKIRIAAALALMAALALIWSYSQSSLGSIADKYYQKDKGLPVEMTVKKNKLDDLMNKFKTADYSSSKIILEQLLQADPANDTLNFFMGLVQYNLEEYQASLTNLKKIQATSLYNDKSMFYLTLDYLKLNDKKNATLTLQRILINKDHPFYSEAILISKELSAK